MMRTANPALSEKVFGAAGAWASSARTMTIQGTVNRTFALLFLLVLTAGFAWLKFIKAADPAEGFAALVPWMIGGVVVGLIAALATAFKPAWAGLTAPVYALAEGLVIGGISAFAELRFPGIVLQAVALTFGVLLCLLFAYKARLIRATEKFKLGVLVATGAVGLIYLATWILGLFGVAVPYLHSNGLIGIGFSAVVVTIAALNLILDFDLIEQGAARGAPRYMEWYGAFALMVTLIWLYIEILRLLSKLRDRR